MKNLDVLNKRKKILLIINISLIVFSIVMFYIVCNGKASPSINTICIILCLISIISIVILSKKLKNIKQQIYDISTISKAIEDSKK